MSDSFFHYTHVVDESDRSSFPVAGAESKRGYHALERTSHPQASHTPSSVSFEPQRNVPSPINWPVDSSVHTLRSATATQCDPSPFPLPSNFRTAPVSLYASGGSPPRSSYSTNYHAHPLISVSDLHAVAMPILTGHIGFGGDVMDAHTYHYHDLPFRTPQDNYMAKYPRAMSSSTITMPTVPTSLGASTSSHMVDPVLPSGTTLLQAPRYLATTLQHPPLSGSTPSPSSSRGFDSKLYCSPGPLSVDNHALTVPPAETLDLIQPQAYITIPVGQPYTLTVPLEAVEFPPAPGAGEAPFFQCCWADCGIWISSEKEAVKYHLTHTHDVVLKGKSTDSACCEWIGCSSSLQRGGLVRHFQTHLGLKWLCSVCKGEYTRQDSVGFHARKEPRCQMAHAVSHPSAVAYSVKINADDTVTLTKVLRP